MTPDGVSCDMRMLATNIRPLTGPVSSSPLLCYKHTTPDGVGCGMPMVCYKHMTPDGVSCDMQMLAINIRPLTGPVSSSPLLCYKHTTPNGV
ncbi:MAG: hypothetical protein JXR41_15715, partial [Bacteroidales bacterium]|nr:hypothetical protein [Bacteroidales bacterium]